VLHERIHFLIFEPIQNGCFICNIWIRIFSSGEKLKKIMREYKGKMALKFEKKKKKKTLKEKKIERNNIHNFHMNIKV